MNKILNTILSILAFSFISTSSLAFIVTGDSILIDFTKDGEGVTGVSGETWNNITTTTANFGGGSLETQNVTLSSNLVRLSDGAATGVGLSIEGLDSASRSGIGGLTVSPSDSSASFPVSGLIPDAAQADVTFHSGGATQFIFTGLDDSLTYDLSFQSYTGSTARNANNWQVNADLSGDILSVDPNDTPSIYTFSNVGTNGSGQITLRSFTTLGGAELQHINAVELTAVPEPSTYALLFGIITLGAVAYRRRIKN